jgi:hypothetical protein
MGFRSSKFLYYFGLPNIWLRALLMKVNPEKRFYALKTGKPIFNGGNVVHKEVMDTTRHKQKFVIANTHTLLF